jgi:energy-coupling factor transport system substrate-specific component
MFTTPRLIAIALCAALNFAVGSIVYLTKLPIYLDSIGTLLCAMLIYPDRIAAFVCAFAAAMLSTVITSLFINPFLIWFTLTEVAIALIAAFVVARGVAVFRERPLPMVKFAIRVIFPGILLGLVSAVVSAPVVAYVFGGVTGSGSAFLVAFFLKAGQHLMSAVLHSGLTAEPIDKSLQVLLAALLFRATPKDFIALVRARQQPAPI